MLKSTLTKQLLSLREDQKDVISAYYHLVSNSLSKPPDIDEVIQIWERAETDPSICTWLEFIDFFFIPSSDDSTIPPEDYQAYLSEYILPLAFQKHPQDSAKNGILDTFSSLILNCPDGNGFIKLPSQIVSSPRWKAFSQEPCPQCDRPFSEHDISFISQEEDNN